MDFFFLDTNILDSWSPEAGIARFVWATDQFLFFFFRWALSTSYKGSFGVLISRVKFHPSCLFIYGHLLGLQLVFITIVGAQLCRFFLGGIHIII